MHFACLVKFRGGTAERVWNFILSHQNDSYPTHLLESWWQTWWHKNSRGIKFESSKQTEQRRHYGDHLKMCFLSNTSISISSYPSSHRLDFVQFFIEMDLEVIRVNPSVLFRLDCFILEVTSILPSLSPISSPLIGLVKRKVVSQTTIIQGWFGLF